MERIDREVLDMREVGDAAAEGMTTFGERFSDVFDLSLSYFREVLSADIPFDRDATEYAKLHNIKLAAASKVIGVGARGAIELRKQNIGALARLLERMKAEPVSIENEQAAIVGYDEDYAS